MTGARISRNVAASFVLITLLIICGCGGSSVSVTPNLPPDPGPTEIWHGTSGNVLISDRGADQDGTTDFLWLGFNSSADLQAFLTLSEQKQLGWIGGRVVVDSKDSLGFYFDPNTVVGAQTTAEGEQTSLDAIKKDPAHFASIPRNRM